MSEYSPAWPHGEIIKEFEGIYVVRGSNITYFENKKIQHSRNMTIIASNGDLALINTVRLNEDGLRTLDTLGDVKHVIRIGAFHGRDDQFYLDRYKACLWTVQPNERANAHSTTQYLKDADKLPIKILNFYV